MDGLKNRLLTIKKEQKVLLKKGVVPNVCPVGMILQVSIAKKKQYTYKTKMKMIITARVTTEQKLLAQNQE